MLGNTRPNFPPLTIPGISPIPTPFPLQSLSGFAAGVGSGIGSALGSYGNPVAGLAGGIGSGLGGMLGGVGGILPRDPLSPLMSPGLPGINPFRGIGSETAEMAEQIVQRLMQVTNQSIDTMVSQVRETTSGVVSFVEGITRDASSRAMSEVDRAFNIAEDVAIGISKIPEEALELVGSGEEILHRARERGASIRRYIGRFRDRRRALPRIVAEHIEEFALEVEEELEADAAEAEMLGERVLRDSRQLYERTVADAERYGTLLLRQTEENARRGNNLRISIMDGAVSVRDWALNRVSTLTHFGMDRMRSGMAIRSLSDAERWSTESISGIQQMASEIEHEVRTRPGEVASFAESRVADAVALATGVITEVQTAQEWMGRQRGNNAAWRLSMRNTRNMAEEFLRAQALRVEGRVIRHGELIMTTARDMGSDLVNDTMNEGHGLALDARDAAVGIGREIVSGGMSLAIELQRAPFTETPRPPNVNAPVVIPVPEPEHQEQGPSDHMNGPATQGPPEAVHVSQPRRNAPRTGSNTSGPVRANSPAANAGSGNRSNTNPSATSAKGSNAVVEAAAPNAGSAPTTKPAAQQPQKLGPGKSEIEPEKKTQKSTSVTTKGGDGKELSNAVPMPKAPPEDSKPSTKPDKKSGGGVKPESQVRTGVNVPKLEKPKEKAPAEKGTSPSAASGVAGPTASSNQPAKPSGAPQSINPDKSLQKAKEMAPSAGTGVEGKKAAEAASAQVNDQAPKPKPSAEMGGKMTGGAEPAKVPQKMSSERNEAGDPKSFQAKLIQAGGEGSTPDAATRAKLTPHVGFDPSMVRIHTGATAQAAASALGADAFTIGTHIFFGSDKFDPRSPQGLGLIGHEVKHVGQQLGMGGDKMRFLTKTGGDAMEQEAQEVGESIASNIAFSTALRVGKYIRMYEPADDEPVTTAISTKLDRLSMLALRKADRQLASRGVPGTFRIEEVEVSLTLEMETMSDTEIVEAWAEAIVSAVESAQPASARGVDEQESAQPSTHLLQMKLGDPTNDPAKPPADAPSPEVLSRIAKITPSSQEKDMIRKLIIRQEVDQYIKAVKARRASMLGQRHTPNSGGGMLPTPRMPHQAVDPDETYYLDKLKTVEINSLEEFEELKGKFVKAFQAKGFNVTNYLLDENLAVVRKQIPRYLSRDSKNPESEINKLKKAAKLVADAMTPYINVLRKYFSGVVNIDSRNLDSMDELLRERVNSGNLQIPKDGIEEVNSARSTWSAVRQQQGNTHVVFLGRDYDPNTILNAKDDVELEMNMLKQFQEVEKNIMNAKKDLTMDKFWELHPMVEMTKQQMGVRKGEGADKTIQEAAEGKANDALLWGVIQAAAAIALAVTAMVATGGLAAVAMIGSAGLSVYSAAKAMDEYAFKAAAANSALDQAKLISKDQPSLFWLAFELVAAGLDLGAAVGAFGKLAGIAAKARAAAGEKAVMEELEKVAKAAYKDTKGLAMSEDDFVQRLLNSAKKATPDAETFAKQAKLVTELLEGTSPRAVAILAGNERAMKGLVMEYGNWKSLVASLKNGGDDAEKMMKNIAAFRQKEISRLEAQGAKALDNASTEAASDFDLNVLATKEEGAGAKVLRLEKEMAESFGPNWSEALLINFYTDKSQLLAVEDALKMMKGSPEHAKIMQRVTEKAEKLNFAKMLEHAGESQSARQQVLELMKDSGVKYTLEELDDVIKGLKGADKEASRASKLLEVDKLQKELEALPPNSPERAKKLEQITEMQMEANFLTKEAYIGPAAVKGGALSSSEAYQNALSQLEMISHVIAENGGDILKASREYELYKYINRYTAAAKKAGVETPRGTFFENFSNYIYKRAREGVSESAHVPGVNIADEAPERAVEAKYLLDMYNEFRGEVKETLPKIKKAAEAKGAQGWTPDGTPKTPPPAAGQPPAPKPAADPGTIKDYTKPGAALEPSKVATLPAATVATKNAGDKAAKEKDKGKTGSLGSHNAVTSAGFGHAKANEGIGMFKTTIPGIDKEVMVTVFPVEEESKFNQQLAAAIAAAGTGVGPKVHGKVDAGPKKLAFALDTVEGGFADSHENKDPNSKFQNKAEMIKNAMNIGPATFVDVDTFRDSIWDKGIRYSGPVEGFVGPDGHWKPVNFANTKLIEVNEGIVNNREQHDYYFTQLKSQLMANHLEAKQQAAKK